MSEVKKAILLAAGFGTRLKPITDHTPKCLVHINNKPLLQLWLEQLSNAGIQEFLINTHYLPNKVIEFVNQSEFRNRVTLFNEPELLGTLGTLKATQYFWKNENVLVAHADNLCICDWTKFIQAFTVRKNHHVGTVMLFETDTPERCGIIELNEKREMIAFHEKVKNPPSNLANAAIYLFDQRVNAMLNELTTQESDISYHLMPHLLGKLTGWLNTGYMRDIGTPESLKTANVDMLKWLK